MFALQSHLCDNLELKKERARILQTWKADIRTEQEVHKLAKQETYTASCLQSEALAQQDDLETWGRAREAVRE